MITNPLILLFSGIIIFISLILALGGIHKIDEGQVGVYYRGGALLKTYSNPGFQTMIPALTQQYQVQISVQTDMVTNIPCGTAGGVMLNFDKVEVVNQLKKEFVIDTVRNQTIYYDKTWIFNKIHHEINQFCSKHTVEEVYITLFENMDEHLVDALQKDCDKQAPGLKIMAIRMTKPQVPGTIIHNQMQMESQKTRLLQETEKQNVVRIEEETKRKIQSIQAQTLSDVSKIQMDNKYMKKKIEQDIAHIDDQIQLDHKKNDVNAETYKLKMELKSMSKKLTTQYLKYEYIKSSQKNKIVYGDKIPQNFIEAGNIFQK